MKYNSDTTTKNNNVMLFERRHKKKTLTEQRIIYSFVNRFRGIKGE